MFSYPFQHIHSGQSPSFNTASMIRLLFSSALPVSSGAGTGHRHAVGIHLSVETSRPRPQTRSKGRSSASPPCLQIAASARRTPHSPSTEPPRRSHFPCCSRGRCHAAYRRRGRRFRLRWLNLIHNSPAKWHRGAHRVEDDVAGQLQQIGIAVHQNGLAACWSLSSVQDGDCRARQRYAGGVTDSNAHQVICSRARNISRR